MPQNEPVTPSATRLGRTLTLAASSALGLGYLPVAPGTWGTFAALPIWYACADWSVGAFVALTAAAVLCAIAISSRAEAIYGEHDVGRIVIDEVVGLMCTVIGVPWRLPEIIAAFLLFRILDAFKPPPIRWFDTHVQGGFGVVIDDVVAGLIGCALLHGARLAHGGLWW
jgi:phosphatidylglycerophosphatase A